MTAHTCDACPKPAVYEYRVEVGGVRPVLLRLCSWGCMGKAAAAARVLATDGRAA